MELAAQPSFVGVLKDISRIFFIPKEYPKLLLPVFAGSGGVVIIQPARNQALIGPDFGRKLSICVKITPLDPFPKEVGALWLPAPIDLRDLAVRVGKRSLCHPGTMPIPNGFVVSALCNERA